MTKAGIFKPEQNPKFHAADVISHEEMQLFREIIELKSEINALEERLNARREEAGEVLEALIKGGEIASYLPVQGFDFQLKSRRTYQYSRRIERLEAALKEAKETKVNKGIAILVKAKPYLEVKLHKGELPKTDDDATAVF